ncbi:SbcC/MukB-like Walker B domain-containing protein, partial [Angustibacter peucedani]
CGALEAASGGVATDAAEQHVAGRRAALEDARASADVVAMARQAREVAQQAVRDALAAQSAADRTLTRASTALGELEPRVAELATGLADLLADATDLDERAARLRDEVAVLRAFDAARRAAGQAVVRQEAARQQLASALAELDLTSAEHARAGWLDPVDVDALAGTVERRRRERSDVEALLAAPELAGLDAVEPPDVAALEATARLAAQAWREAEHRLAVTTRAATSLGQLALRVREHDDVHRELRARHAHVDDLSRCVDGTGGGNALRMRLSAFVLAARLEEVAAAATERLLVMSDGRYALAHTDELARGGARSGLGLQVVDGWTGVARETSTLSGGESFLASLALALGLADVVHAESGGSAIETLFVDEGFGSLDDETLEEVMGVLDGLREGGRAVGIVSHVADLRARIAARVEVRKGRTGSTVRQAGRSADAVAS